MIKKKYMIAIALTTILLSGVFFLNRWQLNQQIKDVIYSEKIATEQLYQVKTIKTIRNGAKTYHYLSPTQNSDDFYQDNLPISLYNDGSKDKEEVIIKPLITKTALKDVQSVAIHKISYKEGFFKLSKVSDKVISRYHIKKDYQPFYFSNLFNVTEEKISQKLKDLSHDDKLYNEKLSALKEDNGLLTDHFEIESDQLVVDKAVNIPFNNIFDIINPNLLEGGVKLSYDDYQKKKVAEAAQKQVKKLVALTFDDGPDPRTTPQVLSLLEKYHAKATFFMLGSKVFGNEALVKRVVDSGNEIGNHSWDHPNLTKLSPEQVSAQIKNTNAAITNVTGKSPSLFRPPYGATNANVQSVAALTQVLWSVDTRDWENRNTEAIMANVKMQLRPGGIILMHDVHQTSVNALPTVLEYLKNQGYECVTVSKILS